MALSDFLGSVLGGQVQGPSQSSYLGNPGAAAQYASDYYNQAQAAQGRQGPQIDYSGAGADYANAQQDRGAQLGLQQQLQGVASGQTQTAADINMRQGLDSAMRQQLSMAANAGPNGAALARYQAAQQGANLAGQGVDQAAVLKAQEQAQARQELAGVNQGLEQQDVGLRGQSAQMAQAQGQLSEEQMQANDRYSLGLGQLGQQPGLAQLQADVQTQQIAEQANAATQQNEQGWVGDAISAGGAMAMLSDARAKEDARQAGAMQAFASMGGPGMQRMAPILGLAMASKQAGQAGGGAATDVPSIGGPQMGGMPEDDYARGLGDLYGSGIVSDDQAKAQAFNAGRLHQLTQGVQGAPGSTAPIRPAPPPQAGLQAMAARSPMAGAGAPPVPARPLMGTPLGQGTPGGYQPPRVAMAPPAGPRPAPMPPPPGARPPPNAFLTSDAGAKRDAHAAGVARGHAEALDAIRQAAKSGAAQPPATMAPHFEVDTDGRARSYYPPTRESLAAVGQLGSPAQRDVARYNAARMAKFAAGYTPVSPTMPSGPPSAMYPPGSAAPPIPPTAFPPVPRRIPSDERTKDQIRDPSAAHQTPISHFLSTLEPKTFQYKDPVANGFGRHLGVMAQDLERTPEGATMVQDTPRGKVVDTRKAAMSGLAALSDHESRLKRLELSTSQKGRISG